MELPAKLNLKNELLTETTQFTNLFSEVGGRAPAVESGNHPAKGFAPRKKMEKMQSSRDTASIDSMSFLSGNLAWFV